MNELTNKIRCYRCGIAKPERSFYPSALKNQDFMCKECRKEYMKEYTRVHPELVKSWGRNRMRRWRERNPQLSASRSKETHQRRKDKANEYSRKYSKEHREIKRAHLSVYLAVKSGKIDRQPCSVCGTPFAEAHHKDYSKSLEITWLCPKHHHRTHKWID